MANVIICVAFDLFHVGYLEMYGGEAGLEKRAVCGGNVRFEINVATQLITPNYNSQFPPCPPTVEYS